MRALERQELNGDSIEKIRAFGSKLAAFLDSKHASKEHKREVLKDVREASDRAGNIAAALVVVGALGFMAETIRTAETSTASAASTSLRYSIKEINTHDGQKVYRHEDAETTQIIDWLAGYGPSPWSQSQRIKFDREHIRQHAHDMEEELPKDFDSFDEKGLTEFVNKQRVDEAGTLVGKVTAEQMRDHVRWGYHITGDETEPGQYAPNPQLYRKLWQLQKQVGAPKIRWEDEEQNPSDDTRVTNKQGRSHYDQTTNTIYLDRPGSAFEDIVAEDSHADQYVNNSAKAFAMQARDTQKIIARISKDKDYNLSYDETYQEPGSIEYNAHKEIEPKLWKELGDVSPKEE